MPPVSSSRPPSPGPSMRVALLVAASSPMAPAVRPGPASSPSMVRRTGMSIAQMAPLTTTPTATCHSASAPVQASQACSSETTRPIAMTPRSSRRRPTRSASAPAKAPSSGIGTMRSMVSSATWTGEPVMSRT